MTEEAPRGGLLPAVDLEKPETEKEKPKRALNVANRESKERVTEEAPRGGVLPAVDLEKPETEKEELERALNAANRELELVKGKLTEKEKTLAANAGARRNRSPAEKFPKMGNVSFYILDGSSGEKKLVTLTRTELSRIIEDGKVKSARSSFSNGIVYTVTFKGDGSPPEGKKYEGSNVFALTDLPEEERKAIVQDILNPSVRRAVGGGVSPDMEDVARHTPPPPIAHVGQEPSPPEERGSGGARPVRDEEEEEPSPNDGGAFGKAIRNMKGSLTPGATPTTHRGDKPRIGDGNTLLDLISNNPMLEQAEQVEKAKEKAGWEMEGTSDSEWSD